MKRKFDLEDFEAWLSNPVTEAFLKRLKSQAAVCRQQWLHESWDGESPDPMRLKYLKARADTYQDMSQVDFEWFVETEESGQQ